jgi:hypothetical protein
MPRGVRSAGDPAPLLRQFGANLRACREEVGSTPEELAAGAGMGLELLIELEEAGGAIPSIGLFLRLAGTLGRRPSELVAGVGWVPYEIIAGRGRSRCSRTPACSTRSRRSGKRARKARRPMLSDGSVP